MPNLSNPHLITKEQLHARYGKDKEKPGSSGRSLQSHGAVALFPGSGGKTKQKPPSLPGQKFPAKRQLYEQEFLTQPLPSATKPPSPSLPPPNHAMPMPRAVVAITTSWHSFICDWAQAIICKFSKLEPLKCQIHHLCQAAWKQREGHNDTVMWLCCEHHPQCKYKTQPEKSLTPPAKNKSMCSNYYPPLEDVFPNPSPAASTITGVGG